MLPLSLLRPLPSIRVVTGGFGRNRRADAFGLLRSPHSRLEKCCACFRLTVGLTCHRRFRPPRCSRHRKSLTRDHCSPQGQRCSEHTAAVKARSVPAPTQRDFAAHVCLLWIVLCVWQSPSAVPAPLAPQRLVSHTRRDAPLVARDRVDDGPRGLGGHSAVYGKQAETHNRMHTTTSEAANSDERGG